MSICRNMCPKINTSNLQISQPHEDTMLATIMECKKAKKKSMNKHFKNAVNNIKTSTHEKITNINNKTKMYSPMQINA